MTSKKRPLVIFGTGEIAQMARDYFEHDSEYNPVAFTVDDEFVTSDTLAGLPVLRWSELQDVFPRETYAMHVALSYMKHNQLREAKYHQAKHAGYELVSYVSSKADRWHNVTVGDNCFILEQNNLQRDVVIGNNVVLWSGNHIGHGTKICDHAYLASHICISGHCVIGERSWIGVNAAVRDFCEIGADTFIGMSVSVTAKKIKPETVMILNKEGATETYAAENPKGQTVRKMYFKL